LNHRRADASLREPLDKGRPALLRTAASGRLPPAPDRRILPSAVHPFPPPTIVNEVTV
jgi:hypothetical protein